MNNNTNRRRRYSARAAAVATTAAVIFGAAACGSETASDNDKAPGAPAAPPAKVQTVPHTPTSADAAERRAAAELQARYLRHYLGITKEAGGQTKDRRQSELRTPQGREIPVP